jgi:hypothetical protein
MNAADELLHQALATVTAVGVDVSGYEFAPVGRATQATVWRGCARHAAGGDVALRLTPKPIRLISRIASLVDALTDVACPRTLALAQMPAGDRLWTVHLCTWIGTGAPQRPYQLGRHLARLHLALADSTVDISDRRLTFERSRTPDPDRKLPPWDVARRLWHDRILAWQDLQNRRSAAQPIHGDLHWDNLVATSSGGFGFLDFDKMMYAAPLFDLAKLIATAMFDVQDQAQFRAQPTTELLQGYESLKPLTGTDLDALEGAAVLLNAETARLGIVYDIEAYRIHASAVAAWWITHRRTAPSDPLGLRRHRRPEARTDTVGPAHR